ncbi:MAG: DUF499 domain-containing protein, partial [Rhodospirillales bacterium]|nr:DUF499 domain-containing protein [Rhodospirillales bacterium]
MQTLELRDEFLAKHMRGTAIELRNKQNTGWAQRGPEDLLAITYPTSDVQRSLEAISAARPGKPIVFLGQRGRGKSHIMALLHHAIESPDAVMQWAGAWGAKLGTKKLPQLKLQAGFFPISETLSNQEYANLWELIFDRHPNGAYYKGKFEQSRTDIPAKSILQDLFAEMHTTLILDEYQTWFDGLSDTEGDTGPKRRQWAFNFIQILSELSKERPDLFMLVVSVRDNATDAFMQIHRDSPVIIDFKGETAKEDRKRLLLHRLFKNRDHFSDDVIEQTVDAYASERNRLLYGDKNAADQSRLRREVVETWPYSPELIALLEDNIMMADAAQETRDLIRILAEVFRARGHDVPVVTAADFHIDDDECGVITLIDSFATTADQEQIRDRAQRNLEAIKEAGIAVPNAREIMSGIWMRSLSAVRSLGGSKGDLQLDITRGTPIDDNAFTAELSDIVENSFNIHPVGGEPIRHCFKLPENPQAKVKAWARNDRHFEPETATAPGMIAVGRDQEFLRKTLEHLLRPEVTEPPSRVIVLDPNWETAPWANVPQQDQPEKWDRQVLLLLPQAPKEVEKTLGQWLALCVTKNRNMVRFLLPKADAPPLYNTRELIILARCTLLANEWKGSEPQYKDIHTRFDRELRKELSDRFDRYALLARWDYQKPEACKFHIEAHQAIGGDIPSAVENHIRNNFFAPEDFETFIIEASKRSETMTLVLSLLRNPSPGDNLIPYLGDQALYERVLRVAANDKIAINRNSEWHCPQPGQSSDEAFRILKQRATPTGWDWNSIYLGTPSEARGGGVTAPPPPTGTPFGGNGDPIGTTPQPPPDPPAVEPYPTGVTTPTTRGGAGPTNTPTEPPSIEPPKNPVIRRSLGPKTGINLLGDLERWALPDKQQVTQTTLTFHGLSIKEVRDLCTKLPPKV